MMQRFLLALACLLVWPTLAAADRALILPLRAERAITDSERSALLEALYAAVSAQGAQPVPDDGAAPTDAPCTEPSCIEPLLTRAAAQHAVELTVWRNAEGPISGVSVSVVTASGDRYAEGAELAPDAQLATAVQTATHGAYVRLERGPGPWIELDGTPAGATITVDGDAAGVLPRRVRVAGGLHRVVVASPGYQASEQMVTVPRNLDAAKHVTIALHPASTSTRKMGSADGDRASPWNYVIGGVAAAAGIVLGIGPLRTALEDGECGRTRAGRCTGVVEMNAGEAVKLVGAGVLIAGGVGFAIWAPLRIDGSGGTAMARLSGRF